MIEYIAQYDYRDDEEIIVITDELIRCKDCNRWDEVTQVCDKFSNPQCAHLTGATGFCKWAERKDDE